MLKQIDLRAGQKVAWHHFRQNRNTHTHVHTHTHTQRERERERESEREREKGGSLVRES